MHLFIKLSQCCFNLCLIKVIKTKTKWILIVMFYIFILWCRGGINITINGQGFSSVQDPRLIATLKSNPALTSSVVSEHCCSSYWFFPVIRTTPHQDNSPLYRYWSWWVVVLVGSGPGRPLARRVSRCLLDTLLLILDTLISIFFVYNAMG